MPFDDEQARGLAIVAYDPRWPSEFGRLAARIGAILASVAEHIDHVGSTAVPGLAVKDCIDIQIRVLRLHEAMIVPSFAELGFHLRPEPWNHIELTAGRQWPKLVFAPPVGERAANVHVRATSSATARRNLLFRGFLRADPTARHAWATFKQRLAQVVTNLADYGQLKQPPTEILMIAQKTGHDARGRPASRTRRDLLPRSYSTVRTLIPVPKKRSVLNTSPVVA